MTNHVIWLAPLLSIILTLIFIILFTFIAEKNNWLDNPDNRKKHKIPTPLIGGLSIFFTLVILCISFNFPKKFEIIIYSSTLLVLIGFIDDIYNLRARTRFFFQIVSVLTMIIFSNLFITDIGPFYVLNEIKLFSFSIPFTVFIAVGLINTFNFTDGIDGLAGGQAIVTIIILTILLKLNNSMVQLEFLSIFVSVLFIYTLVNTSILPIKKIFLGDAGSTLIGFIISFILIYYSQDPIKIITPFEAIWCLVIPVFDAISVTMIRIKNGKSPFFPDRNHLHYLIIDNGFSKNYALIIILLISFITSLFGILLIDLAGEVTAFFVYLLLFIIYIYTTLNIKLIINFVNKNFKI